MSEELTNPTEEDLKISLDKLFLRKDDILVVEATVELGNPESVNQLQKVMDSVSGITKHDKILMLVNKSADLSVLSEMELNKLGYYKRGKEEKSRIITLD